VTEAEELLKRYHRRYLLVSKLYAYNFWHHEQQKPSKHYKDLMLKYGSLVNHLKER